MKRPETPEKLFTQVIEEAQPKILRLWEQGDRFFSKSGVTCDKEILHDNNIGRSYYQCNPHFWQCYWEGGVVKSPAIEIDLFGQTFHVVAKAHFDPIAEFSQNFRFSKLFKKTSPGIPLQYGYIVDIAVQEIPGVTQSILLADSCRDIYLPERLYGYGKIKDKSSDGFIWDNFDRKIFVDKFYVSNRQVNEWRVLTGEGTKVIADRKEWPKPALISLKEQKNYCAFYGKRLMEAHLFDAATMSPIDTSNTMPEKILRPATPWQRDMNRSFLGMARINPDYQLTPLDCQLAQVKDCAERFYTTDSATWMGMNFALGFHSESLRNPIEPKKNLKLSSRQFPASSTVHELGILESWDGNQTEDRAVAFRCYEEVIP